MGEQRLNSTWGNSPIFLKPLFKELIWGGHNLRDKMGLDAPSGDIGECWAISALDEDDCEVENRCEKNCDSTWEPTTLGQLYYGHPELFGNFQSKKFPLLSKIIDAAKDLSIQVHPDDAYATEYEGGARGKSECWYILDCKPDATIIFGQRCKNREEFAARTKAGEWDEVLIEKPIHPGDFMQIDPGTVHAIKEGTIIVENQQSSDLTYRVYDYNRLQDGKPRELHIDKAMDVINFEAEEPQILNYKNTPVGITTLEENDKYAVKMLNVEGEFSYDVDKPFVCCIVIEGSGTVETDGGKFNINAYESFILPSTIERANLRGNLKLLLSIPK